LDRARVRALGARERDEARGGAIAALRELAPASERGWTAPFVLIGSRADVMVVHFRDTLDAVGEAQRRLAREPISDLLAPTYSFLSVTEAGFYHTTAQLAADAERRGGHFGDEEFTRRMAERLQRELESPHVRKRLYPPPPSELEMAYACFYPMNKKRSAGQNWYALPLAERSRLMMEHGLTGRRYAGRVFQVITGAIGLDAWEWGVTLFAKDPLLFKKIVSEMRFDEASALYAEFGEFWVGKAATAEEWAEAVLG
jgi:chlorite dismutase